LTGTGSGPGTGANAAAAVGALGGIYLLNGGSGYSSPVVNISAPNVTGGVQAVATALASPNGQIIGVKLTTSGSGYTTPPTITITDTATSANNAVAVSAPAWSPVLITVPWATGGASLTINLTNNLSFSTGGGSNNIPTSIVIVGQVGGGLGDVTKITTTQSPDHSNAQGCPTWFIAANPPGTPCTSPSATSGTPPAQGPRVQSMAQEVTSVTPATLTWSALKPGTYLLESGTHPSIQVPMGLIGMLVVTTPPSAGTVGTAYPQMTTPGSTNTAAVQAAVPAQTYSAEVPLEFSEIDPVQNRAVDMAVRTAGFSETAVWSRMNFDDVSSLTLTNGGSGYTAPLSVTFAGGGSGASGASATATLGGFISGITLGGGGTGYTAPTVSISDTSPGIGTGATATATVSGGVITGLTITDPGSNYSNPVVQINDTTGTGATATAATTGMPGVIYSVALTNGGGQYSSVPNVMISGATGSGATATAGITLAGCGTSHTCYPPAVNYTPFYYLINGLAFDKTNPTNSLFAVTAGVNTTSAPGGGTTTSPATSNISGNLLVRLVNAGLRMHVPQIVGSQTTGFNGAGGSATVGGFTLIAEDGNPVPNIAAPRVKTEVFMAAGKTYDVMVNGPAAATAPAMPAPMVLPIYDRELSLSANSSIRDAGMLAYIGVNGGTIPGAAAGTGVFAPAQAIADTYASVILCASAPCLPLNITDPSKGVIANDVNVYGVALSSPSPANGTLTCNVLSGNPVAGICANGTFTYTPNPGWTASTTDTFGYCANGATSGAPPLCTTVTLTPSTLTGGPTAVNITYTSKMATFLKIPSPGVLSVDSDANGLPLSVVLGGTTPPALPTGATLVMDAQGGFTASVPSGAGNASCPTGAPTLSNCWSFTYLAQNSQGTQSNPATVTLVFPPPSNLTVKVVDAQNYKDCTSNPNCSVSSLPAITDYRWIIEEDKTFYIDPNCTTNSSINTPGCPTVVGPAGQSTVPTFGVNFHTSNMDFVAQGCTGQLSCEGGQTMLDTQPGSPTFGQHIPAVCDLGNGACRPDTTGNGFVAVTPDQVNLDPKKRYYISVLPGDAANPFPAYAGQPQCGSNNTIANAAQCGHTMSGAPIPPACNILGGPNACTNVVDFSSTVNNPIRVLVLPTPLPTGKLSVVVFEDDFPLNGEQDNGGGIDVVAPVEPGLGGFNLVLWDTYGGLGDVTGQDSNDMFNQPLSNSLSGTIDPSTGFDACPVSANATQGPAGAGSGLPGAPNPGGITGMIVTCPKYESDGKTLSPLAGQAVIGNLMPDKFSVQAYPGADRIARGEEWIQTNTLDGQHPHDSFIRIGEPSYFQEYGPAGYHVSIGFANPAIINARHDSVCLGAGSPGATGPCTNTIDGQVDVERLSRTPDQRLYPSGSRDAFAWTQCWVSLGDPDGEDFMFTKCDANGNFAFTGVPGGNWRLTIGDQWNDQIIDGLSTAANVGCVPKPGASTCTGGVSALHMGNIGVQQWQANLYTKTFIDDNKNGIWDPGEIGIPLIYTMIHYRDGSRANALTTDFNGVAPFNETFPLFNWYVVESDSTRYKTTGTHTVYDAGGPADGSPSCTGGRPCGTSTAYNFLSNTNESVPLPADLSVPGAVYCKTADCSAEAASFAAGTAIPSSSTASTGRIDPPWVWAEGWSGLTSASNWIEFGKAPYASCPPACTTVTFTPAGATSSTSTQVGENGGIYGQIQYASTRPFDSAAQMIQQPWEPYVPHVTVNLYQEGFAADGVTPTLTLVDTTQSGSWDDWAQGFYPSSNTALVQVASVAVTSGGTGYKVGDTIGLTGGGGTGAVVAVATITGTGAIATVNLLSTGSDYTAPPTIDTTLTGTGLGAVLAATLSTPLTTDAKPYMSCPGQGTNANGAANQDLFYFTLFDQPNYLDWYNSQHNGGTLHTLPYNSQYKCYDAMHVGNQLQPAPYDGRYSFPSSLGIDPTTGKPVTTVGSTNGVTAKMAGTNCTICVANPDSTDSYRYGTPMLPPGKYVVQVMMPAGYEIYKEEDKNLLIGDNYIAPVTQEFGGLGGYIFIMPDQATLDGMYDPNGNDYNPNNFQNEGTNLNLQEGSLSGVPGFPGYTDQLWPCVGEMRVVPDYLSLFPHQQEVAPFAGATRPLCDRKEVNLTNQMAARVKFALFTSTHIAAKYTGVITDDFTSEFDPFAPQFGEKFAPPNMSISTKDYLGNELSRVYSDHWGIYDGLTFSSWAVNPPNITGYSPSMMTQCMNDPGPIPDPNHPGQMITDPLYNPAYSDFCYEEPYMPGLTAYLDTPVVPTQAFVGAGYNNPDCSYPDATPAVKEVDGDGVGPWVSAAGNTLTITALGDIQAPNSAYSGPSASAAPFNMKTITRHYGFGDRCLTPTANSATCNTLSTVTVGGVNAIVTGWTGTQITVTVPGPTTTCTIASSTCNPTPVPTCTIQQQAQYGNTASALPPGQSPTARCGELVITAGNGKQSIDTVTVTIGGKGPTHVGPSSSVQGAIDAALPGDLIMVDPGSHTEMLIMWKPVRLQGVGAVSSIINANSFPAGTLLDPWRRHINCLFGLTLTGVPYTSGTNSTQSATNTAPYDPSGSFSCPDNGWNPSTFNAQPNSPQIDRLPLEATVGWDATLNGNLAEQLQEPSLMGAYEGAGITVLAKGLEFHGAAPWSDGTEAGAFPTGTTLLTGVGPNPLTLPTGDTNPLCHTVSYSPSGRVTVTSQTNPYPSNFTCNPSSIDGLSVINSSQGGGGIFAHGWAHHLQVANNRVYNNAGTLTGGISVGQGEFAGPYVQGGAANAAPGSCSNGTGFVTNQHLPFCLQLGVNVHNNYITNNSSLGDELFSATLSGGGGVTFCTGNDYYLFNFNWVCGNLSSGEGGGLVHLGEIQNGDIEHNSFILNQSDNPTIPTNGGAIQVMGTPDTDPVCGSQPDADCPPGLSDGIGHNLVINANLIQGNMAESGSGGGIRLQQVNGTEVSTFPTRPNLWNNVSITNNIIINNVAGWDGAGISLQDSLNVSIVNNTIASNDSVASSGVLTQSIGTPVASAPAGECHNAAGTASCPQSAGVTSTQNSTLLTTSLTGLRLTCPTGQSNCAAFSNPSMIGNLIWQNRSFYIGVGNLGQGNLNQQNLVSLFNAFTGTAAPVQTASGQCNGNPSYWDIGVRGDTGPGKHDSGFTLNPTYSILDDPGYATTDFAANPAITSQYCNGSRVPPECSVANGCGGPSGYGVPPGIVDASAPNPVFSLTPSATVDEGNNWINVSWGPLALSNDAVQDTTSGRYGAGPLFANYVLQPTSPAIDYVPVAQSHPTKDFFGNPRPDTGNTARYDVGAIEYQHALTTALLVVDPSSYNFGSVPIGTTPSPTVALTLRNDGGATATGITLGTLAAPFSRTTCGTTLAAGATCTITVTYTPTAVVTSTGSLTITASVPVNGAPVALSGTGVAAIRTATVAPTSLAFGNHAYGSTSAAQTLTVTNTGNIALAGGTFTFGGGTPQPFARAAAGGTCGATLALGASCTFNVVFAPAASALTTPTSFSRTLTVAYTGATVTGSSVTLTGTGTPIGTLSFTAATNGTLGTFLGVRTLTFAIPTPRAPVTSVVTVTNTGGASLAITAETLALNIGGLYSITAQTCTTSSPLAPNGTCTVSIHYATPTTLPIITDVGLLNFANNGSGTVGGVTGLALSAR
jgi:hypothetical protein